MSTATKIAKSALSPDQREAAIKVFGREFVENFLDQKESKEATGAKSQGRQSLATRFFNQPTGTKAKTMAGRFFDNSAAKSFQAALFGRAGQGAK